MDLNAFSMSYLVQGQQSQQETLTGTHNGIRGPLDDSNSIADSPFQVDLVSCSWDESTAFEGKDW